MWSGVSIVVGPDGELITLAKLKQRLRIDIDDDDGILADFLKGAIARVDGPSGIGYALLEQTWRKSMDCFPWRIELPGAPIKSVATITYVDPEGTTQTLPASDYVVDIDREPVRIEPAYGLSWPSTRHVIGAVKINYVLGENAADDVLGDLVDAICLLVAHRYENREAVVVGSVVSELPLAVEYTLREHRRGHVAA